MSFVWSQLSSTWPETNDRLQTIHKTHQAIRDEMNNWAIKWQIQIHRLENILEISVSDISKLATSNLRRRQ